MDRSQSTEPQPHARLGLARILLLFLGLLLIAGLATLVFTHNFGSQIRWIYDWWDFTVYSHEGDLLSAGQLPYVEFFSEYPQIALLVFAVPHWLLHWLLPGLPVIAPVYAFTFSLFMMLLYAATLALLYNMLPAQRRNRAFLLLLPASLYFAVNRFDLVPALLTLLSLRALSARRLGLAGMLLAVATFTKWYAALLLPIYLQYVWSTERRISWRMLLAYALASLVIVAPTFASGGVAALLAPYRFQTGRGLEPGSLLFLVNGLFGRLGLNAHGALLFVSLPLQFAVLPLMLTTRIRTIDQVTQWSVISLAGFVLFSRFYSPQWLLWVMPFLILLADRPLDLAFIVAFDLATYIVFPVLFDLFHGAKMLYALGAVTPGLMLAAYLAHFLAANAPDNWLYLHFKRRRAQLPRAAA